MKRKMLMVLPLMVLFALPAFAQEDGGVTAPAITLSDGGVVTNPGALDSPTVFIGYIYQGVKTGDWLTAVAAFLVLLISLLKMFGAKVHALIPDSSWLDKPFWFLLETKPGGWIMNFLLSMGLGAGTELIAEGKVTWAVLKYVLMVSLSAAAIWGAIKDFMDWLKERKAVKNPPPADPAKPTS